MCIFKSSLKGKKIWKNTLENQRGWKLTFANSRIKNVAWTDEFLNENKKIHYLREKVLFLQNIVEWICDHITPNESLKLREEIMLSIYFFHKNCWNRWIYGIFSSWNFYEESNESVCLVQWNRDKWNLYGLASHKYMRKTFQGASDVRNIKGIEINRKCFLRAPNRKPNFWSLQL